MDMETNLQRAPIDADTLELLTTAFRLYEIAKMDNNVYRKDKGSIIAKNLILQYYRRVNPNYNGMIYGFRRKYISNEAVVENNNTPEEREGLNLVYDYIEGFDAEKDDFNIFITALKIHSLLYRPLDAKSMQEVEETAKRAMALKEEATKERNLEKLRQARAMLKSNEGQTFGGKLRTTDVVMQDYQIDVPDPTTARIRFNEFLTPEKKEEYDRQLNGADLLSYINYAVNTTTDLIGLQPFGDGNKRTFRSLLNLMFKKRNLPPVYITKRERKAYHDALEKALKAHDYDDLDSFYYYKICDSIYELDFAPYLRALQIKQEEDKKPCQ